MNVNTENSVSITEANRNFYCVARSASDEDILALSKRLIEKNREAYEVPAKWLLSPKNRSSFCTIIDPAPHFSKDLGSGITDVGFLCDLICFIKFMLDVVYDCRVLFDIISEIVHWANINHNATSFILLFYHNFIIKTI